MEKINWGRMLSKKKALRVVVQRNLVRIQLGHVVPATNDEKIHSFVLDVEIPLGVEATYDLASALGAAAFEANRPWPWGRKGALALEEEPSVEHPRRTSPSSASPSNRASSEVSTSSVSSRWRRQGGPPWRSLNVAIVTV